MVLTFGLNFSLFMRRRANFSLYGLNFSLFLRGRAQFSLLVWISHFVAVHVWISHFMMFEFLTLPAGHTRTPAGPISRGQPTPTPALPMTWLIPCYGLALARRQITVRPACVQKVRNSECRRAKSEKLKPKSEKLARARRQSEKFKPQKWEIGARAPEKWEIGACAATMWEIQTKSENQIIIIFV